MTERNCGSCRASRMEKIPVGGQVNFKQRECHMHPAQVNIVAMPKQTPAGIAVELKILSAFPTVQVSDDCEEWKPKDADLN